MTKVVRGIVTGLLVVCCMVGGTILRAEQPVVRDQVATVEQLKAAAFTALRAGQFDKVNELIARAASMSDDPSLTRMADWLAAFEQQRQQFRADRLRSYNEEVEKVQKLLAGGMPDYAMRAAAIAYTYVEDKEQFRREPWVVDLIHTVTRRADEYEASGEWLKAVRLYSDLVSIEPFNPNWKERQKLAFRRVRLISAYTPDRFKQLQESDLATRKAADALLSPATQPSTQPAEAGDEPFENDEFKINWRDSLNGVRADMLREALDHARTNYWRDVGYDVLMTGGLRGIRAVLTTDGLQDTFAGLKDRAKVARFIDVIDEELASIAAGAAADRNAMQRLITRMQAVNMQTVDLPEEVFVSEFADGAFGELDPFSAVIWPSEVEEFNKSTQGEFSGVGVQIQSDTDGSLKVVTPIEDSPAWRAKIRAGDIITHVNGRNVKGISVNQAVKIITGPPNTDVTLTIRNPAGESRDVTLTRRTIKVASLKGWLHLPGGGWDYFIDPDNKIAYLRLTNFSRDTSRELNTALRELNARGAKGVVLDLRYNPGGLLAAAADVSDAFLRDGEIVSTRSDRPDDPNQPTLSARRLSNDTDLPLVVLVNQYSASASEIVSGAMRERSRGLVVGERTFGKGSVQMLFPLANRSAYLKLTTSHYYLPGGKNIHRDESSTEWGVDPHVLIEMTPEQMRAAIDARSKLDVLRDPEEAGVVTPDAEVVREAEQSLLASDPQLTAALLLLRMHLAGAPLM
jgi:carboxyl-terminal processing protease